MAKFIRDTQLDSYSNERENYQPKRLKKIKKFKDREDKSFKKK